MNTFNLQIKIKMEKSETVRTMKIIIPNPLLIFIWFLSFGYVGLMFLCLFYSTRLFWNSLSIQSVRVQNFPSLPMVAGVFQFVFLFIVHFLSSTINDLTHTTT